MTYSSGTPHVKNVLLHPDQWGALAPGGNRPNLTDTRDAYARVPLVFRATRIRCNSFLKIPHHLVKLKGDGETEVEYPFGDLDALLWKTQAALLLCGGSYILKQRNTVRTVGAQWLNPFTVQVAWNGTLNRREFSQSINGKRFPANGAWTDEDMIFIREFGLADDIGPGVASAAVGLTNAQLKHYLMVMASTFFESGGMPVTVLSTVNGGFSSRDERERVQGFFKRAIAGVRNFARVIAVDGDIKITTSQPPFKDLAMPELSDEARKDVARAFELPVTLLDSDETFATAKEHRRQYYDDTVIPAAKLIVGGLNDQHLHPLGLHLELAPEEMDIYQESEAERATALQAVTAALTSAPPNVVEGAMLILGYTVPDEARRLIFQVQPEQPETAVPAESEDEDEDTDATAQPKRIEAAQFRRYVAKKGIDHAYKFTFRVLDEAAQQKLWDELGAVKLAYGSPEHKARMSEFDRRAAKHERAFIDAITALFEKQGAELAKRIADGDELKAGLTPASWEKMFIEMVKPLLLAAFADAARSAFNTLGLTKVDFDVSNPKVAALLAKQAQRFAEQVNATTWDLLKKSLDEGLAGGESLPSLAARVQAVMGDRIRSSAETIARTEIAPALHNGTMFAWKESGVVSGKTYLAAIDSRTRDTHAQAHGQTVGLDEPFMVGGYETMVPGATGVAEEDINCRCSMVAEIN